MAGAAGGLEGKEGEGGTVLAGKQEPSWKDKEETAWGEDSPQYDGRSWPDQGWSSPGSGATPTPSSGSKGKGKYKNKEDRAGWSKWQPVQEDSWDGDAWEEWKKPPKWTPPPPPPGPPPDDAVQFRRQSASSKHGGGDWDEWAGSKYRPVVKKPNADWVYTPKPRSGNA